MALLLYSDAASPAGPEAHLLTNEHRQRTANLVNAALLKAQGLSSRTPLSLTYSLFLPLFLDCILPSPHAEPKLNRLLKGLRWAGKQCEERRLDVLHFDQLLARALSPAVSSPTKERTLNAPDVMQWEDPAAPGPPPDFGAMDIDSSSD